MQRPGGGAAGREITGNGGVGQVDERIGCVADHHIGGAGEIEGPGNQLERRRDLRRAGDPGVDVDRVAVDSDAAAGHRTVAGQRDRRRLQRNARGSAGNHAEGVDRERVNRRKRQRAVVALRGQITGNRIVGEEACGGGIRIRSIADDDRTALEVVDDGIRRKLRAARYGDSRRLQRDRRRAPGHGSIDLCRRTDADRGTGHETDVGAGERSVGDNGPVGYACRVERDAARNKGVVAGVRRAGDDLAARRRSDAVGGDRDVAGIGERVAVDVAIAAIEHRARIQRHRRRLERDVVAGEQARYRHGARSATSGIECDVTGREDQIRSIVRLREHLTAGCDGDRGRCQRDVQRLTGRSTVAAKLTGIDNAGGIHRDRGRRAHREVAQPAHCAGVTGDGSVRYEAGRVPVGRGIGRAVAHDRRGCAGQDQMGAGELQRGIRQNLRAAVGGRVDIDGAGDAGIQRYRVTPQIAAGHERQRRRAQRDADAGAAVDPAGRIDRDRVARGQRKSAGAVQRRDRRRHRRIRHGGVGIAVVANNDIDRVEHQVALLAVRRGKVDLDFVADIELAVGAEIDGAAVALGRAGVDLRAALDREVALGLQRDIAGVAGLA